jgi:hypothetical protein
MSDIYSLVPEDSVLLDSVSLVVNESSADKNSNYWFISVAKEPGVLEKLYSVAFERESWEMQYAIIFDSFDDKMVHLFVGIKGTRHLRIVKKITDKFGLKATFRARFKKLSKAFFRGVLRGGCYFGDYPVPLRGIYIEIFPEDEAFIEGSYKSFLKKVC